MSQVTVGSIKALYNGEKDTPLVNSPLVQIINIKSIPATSGTRYRAIISDGVNFMQAMLASHHASIVEDGSLKRYSVIRLKESVCNELQNRKILIILNMEIVTADVESKIGNPLTLESNPAATGAASSSGQQQQQKAVPTTPTAAAPAAAPAVPTSEPLFANNNNNSNTGFGRPSVSNMGGSMQMEASLTPIKNLNPYQNKWTIKARVTMKTPIKTWHNQRSDGKLFSVNFLDQSGEIRATGFNDQVDRFYNLLEDGKVYYISKARVSMAKKQFSNLSNEYELQFEPGTEIEACSGEVGIPQMSYDFVKIADIDKHEKHTSVDVLGVVMEDLGLGEIVSKASGKPTSKRDLILVDDSRKQIKLTLWDTVAQEFDSSGYPIIAGKGLRVGDFGGRNLSASQSSMVKKNPDIPAATQLRQWYTNNGQSTTFETFNGMSIAGGSLEGGMGSLTKKMTLQQAKSDQLGSSYDKADYFSFRGTVTFIKAENCAYPACPDCRKKMVMESSGWRCEKCQKMFEGPQWKYIMSINVYDSTSQLYVNLFDETGNIIMNMGANEFTTLRESDGAEAKKVVNNAMYKMYNFKVRAKTETFNDLSRVKYHVLEVNPVDYCNESKELVGEIETLLA